MKLFVLFATILIALTARAQNGAASDGTAPITKEVKKPVPSRFLLAPGMTRAEVRRVVANEMKQGHWSADSMMVALKGVTLGPFKGDATLDYAGDTLMGVHWTMSDTRYLKADSTMIVYTKLLGALEEAFGTAGDKKDRGDAQQAIWTLASQRMIIMLNLSGKPRTVTLAMTYVQF